LVKVTNASARVFTLDHSSAMAGNPAARRIEDTRSFRAAETAVRELLGFTELDFERRKASSLSPAATVLPFDRLPMAIPEVAGAAAARGATMISFRRLSEQLGIYPYDATRIREVLASDTSTHPTLPLYFVDGRSAAYHDPNPAHVREPR
jgi:Protein of unknown function (DUF1152)